MDRFGRSLQTTQSLRDARKDQAAARFAEQVRAWETAVTRLEQARGDLQRYLARSAQLAHQQAQEPQEGGQLADLARYLTARRKRADNKRAALRSLEQDERQAAQSVELARKSLAGAHADAKLIEQRFAAWQLERRGRLENKREEEENDTIRGHRAIK